jgi:hypothetical protein
MASLLLAAAFGLVAGVGCDGGGEGDVTPTPTTGEGTLTPTQATGEVEQQLQQIALQVADLPSGVTQAEDHFVTNDLAAASSEDSEQRLALLEEWGRILGYDVTYQSSPDVMDQIGLLLTNSTSSLYSNEEGASASFADAVQTARTTDWASYLGVEYGVDVEELASPAWVDEMLWLRITAKPPAGEEPDEETITADMIIFRQGPARGSLQIVWIMGRTSSDLIVQIAEAQAQHLKDAFP